ncbi:MAG: hypothetical protein QM803_00990 [Rhodocyclaceae bacterium]
MTTCTVQQIATALGISKQATTKRCLREHWPHTEERARGGLRRVFDVTRLPADVRSALTIKALEEINPRSVMPSEQSYHELVVHIADATDQQRRERDARIGVVALVRQMQVGGKCSQEAALTTLLTRAKLGDLSELHDKMLRLARDRRGRKGVDGGYPTLRTLKRWLAAADLTPRVPQKDMRIPTWLPIFLSAWQVPQKPSIERAYEKACAQWPIGERPSVHQVRRWLTKLGYVARHTGRMGSRELKTVRPFIRRDFSALEPNDVWTADGHTFDAEVQHPLTGRPFRPEITTVADVATRRIVGWSIDLAESSFAVIDALRNGVERCGVPAVLYVDNGSGYRNALVADEAVGLVGRLGC